MHTYIHTYLISETDLLIQEYLSNDSNNSTNKTDDNATDIGSSNNNNDNITNNNKKFRRTVEFRNFIVFLLGRDPGTLKSDIVSKKHPQLNCSDLRLST